MSALNHQEGGNHYAKLEIQPIEYIHANGMGFAEGSVIKYVTRWRDKNGIADLKKARHFLDLLIELEEKREIVGMTAQQAIEFEDKELPSSGIYSDEGYTEADKAAASLDPALVELCSNTTIHADEDGWRDHIAEGCPIENDLALVEVETGKGSVISGVASNFEWGYDWRKPSYPNLIIKRWRYAK